MTEGVKYDKGKPRFELLPQEALLEVSKVLTFGAEKYGAENWRNVPDLRNRYLGAAHRHINAYMRGELRDEETGLSHLAHATCCLMFIEEYN